MNPLNTFKWTFFSPFQCPLGPVAVSIMKIILKLPIYKIRKKYGICRSKLICAVIISNNWFTRPKFKVFYFKNKIVRRIEKFLVLVNSRQTNHILVKYLKT